MKTEFRSNGKLLLTGEYAVLDGALSLAVPTRFGQSLHISENNTALLSWKSLDYQGKSWFETRFELPGLIEDTNGGGAKDVESLLKKILVQARSLNPKFLSRKGTGYSVETKLEFPRDWGLGTSSTLINNIAQWAGVDAFELLRNSLPGSGYDIACAQHNSPLLYRLENKLPIVRPIRFSPAFTARLFFVHLKRKQNSREAISTYRNKKFDRAKLVSRISEITGKVTRCSELQEFRSLMEAHEKILSEILGVDTIKSTLFPDFKGTVKSLGAWGGDFVLAIGDSGTTEYFQDKGYPTVLPYSDMVLN